MEVTRLRKAPKNHILFFKGDNRDRLSGYVKLEDTDSSGSFLYTDYMKHDTMFPYGGMFLEKIYDFSARAITDIEYFYIPVDLYESFVATNSAQIKILCQKLSRLLRLHEICLRNVALQGTKTFGETFHAFAVFCLCYNGLNHTYRVENI